MESIEAADCAAAFAKELLRAGNMLYGLASNLVERLPGDAYPDEAPETVVIEMITGTIRTSLEGVDQRELQRASELISGACDRVLEHLQLALELSRRMHGRADGGGGRTYG